MADNGTPDDACHASDVDNAAALEGRLVDSTQHIRITAAECEEMEKLRGYLLENGLGPSAIDGWRVTLGSCRAKEGRGEEVGSVRQTYPAGRRNFWVYTSPSGKGLYSRPQVLRYVSSTDARPGLLAARAWRQRGDSGSKKSSAALQTGQPRNRKRPAEGDTVRQLELHPSSRA